MCLCLCEFTFSSGLCDLIRIHGLPFRNAVALAEVRQSWLSEHRAQHITINFVSILVVKLRFQVAYAISYAFLSRSAVFD